MIPRSREGREHPVLLHVTTVPMSLTFLRGQTAYMKSRGVRVHALSSPGDDLTAFGDCEAVPVHAIAMTREITPLQDLIALAGIRRVLRTVRPDIVHAHTPKAGLLGMLAATTAGPRVKVYQMRGLPFRTASGWKRRMLKWSEKVSCGLADLVICNSRSLREIAVAEGLCAPDRIRVLGTGSGNGVDATGRFDPDGLPAGARSNTRARLGIPADALVVGFVGRLTRDKGVVELTEAWRRLREEDPGAHLVVVGPFESRDPIPAGVRESLSGDPRVHLTGMDWDTPPLYAAMDVVVLPTYREGFPNVPLEAAAMRLPVVATRVEGCVDAVEDGVTGLLVPARDPGALLEAVRRYAREPETRAAHGRAGRERVLRDFRPEALWDLYHREYLRLGSDAEPVAAAGGRERGAGAIAKRSLDVLVAIVGLVLLSLVLASIAVLVRARLGRPVLFRQVRPGRDGEPFTIYKFRTMRAASDASGHPLPDEARMTRLGEFLRKTSLDELPELWNVLKGDMSLVGPRPLLMEYLPLFSPREMRRHEVRPGITGWAQVNGRNDTSWQRRLELDTWYVDHRSFLLDLRILLLTLRKVLVSEGIHQQGRATMERFKGTTEV
ncbi:MAG TPA: sugar transferase [Longimicrobiaceae bacterium]|nr:sugar transferase [Longimicrobiaceae bacterium]